MKLSAYVHSIGYVNRGRSLSPLQSQTDLQMVSKQRLFNGTRQRVVAFEGKRQRKAPLEVNESLL